MKRIYLFIIIVSVFSLGGAYAQSSQNVIDKVSDKIKSYKNITVDFTLKSSQIDGSEFVTNGVMILSKDKYRITIDDVVVYSDGIDQYTFNKENKEVVIERVNSSSLLSSPSKLLSISQQDFTLISTKPEGLLTKSTLISKKIGASNDAKRVELLSDSNYNITEIRVYEGSGLGATFVLKSIKTNTVVDENIFKMDKSTMQGVEIIDFR